jgi:hypothetical protein
MRKLRESLRDVTPTRIVVRVRRLRMSRTRSKRRCGAFTTLPIESSKCPRGRGLTETTTATLEAPPNLPLTTKIFSHHITGRASSATQALKSLRLNLSVTTNTTITKKQRPHGGAFVVQCGDRRTLLPARLKLAGKRRHHRIVTQLVPIGVKTIRINLCNALSASGRCANQRKNGVARRSPAPSCHAHMGSKCSHRSQ